LRFLGDAYSLFNTHNNRIPLLFIIAYKLNEVLQYFCQLPILSGKGALAA